MNGADPFRPNRREMILGGAAFGAALSFGMMGFSLPAFAQRERLWLSGSPVQGGLVLGRAGTGARAWLNESPLRVADGQFCFGFGRDETKPFTVRVMFEDGREETQTIIPRAREFPTERVNGLPEQYVSPPKEVQDRIARDAKVVTEARLINTDETWFLDPFDWPIEGRISGQFGAQRILNGEPREPHYGIDIAAPTGTPIKAPAEAIVRMAEDLYLSGNTLVLDHGHGVSTTYLHTSRMDVKPGDHVRRGTQIGLVGQTGRATGAHLCWRMNWLQTRLDAALCAVPRSDKA